MRKTIMQTGAAIVFVMALIFSSEVAAQTTSKKGSKTVNVVGKKTAKTRGAKQDIKAKTLKEHKPAPKSRGNGPGECTLNFINNSGHYVAVYVDRDGNKDLIYRGELSPNSNGSIIVGDGYTKVYCETSCDDSYMVWEDFGYCNDYDEVTYNLE